MIIPMTTTAITTKAMTTDISNTNSIQPNLISSNPSNTINIKDNRGSPTYLNISSSNNPEPVMIGGGEEKEKQWCMDIVQTSLSHPSLLYKSPFLSGPRQLKEQQRQQQQPKKQEQIIPLLSSSSDIALVRSNYKTSNIQDQIQLTQTYSKLVVQEHYSQNSQSQHQPQLCGMKDDDQQWIEFFANTNNFNEKDNDDKSEGEIMFHSSSMIKKEEVMSGNDPASSILKADSSLQVKKEGKKREEEEVMVTKKEDDSDNDKGFTSWVEEISPTTNDASPTAASTNHCVRRKFNCNNNKNYDDVDNNVDDERKSPPKKKRRVLAGVKEDINCEVDHDYKDDDDDDAGDDDGGGVILTKIASTGTKRKFHENVAWHKHFQRLVAYKQQHKTTIVPIRYKEEPKLGGWVMLQRTKHKKQRLPKHRVDILNSVGFVWDPLQAKWMEMYQKLVVHKQHHKSISVSFNEDRNLAMWVSHQRNHYKNKDLSVQRINYLESIGFVWKIYEHIPWMKMYERLVAYKHCHQSTQVPQRYTEDPRLGNWVNIQRGSYNKGKLSAKRIELLNSIDFGFFGKKIVCISRE